MGVCQGFFDWFCSIKPPKAEEGILSTHLDKILKPYAKGLVDQGSYYRFICPRSQPHGGHTKTALEDHPTCVAYKSANCFATDFHLNPNDPGFNIPPFQLWCLLKYGSFDPNVDNNRYPEFCTELGIVRADLSPAIDLIKIWAMQAFKFRFREKWTMYSETQQQYVNVSVFSQSADLIVLEDLRVRASECNPPKIKRSYTIDKMPAFYRSWSPMAFHQLRSIMPEREVMDPVELPRNEQETFAFKLRSLLHKPITYSFKGTTKPFITSLLALAGDLKPSKEWQSFEDYPIWFKLEEMAGAQEELFIAMTFDFVAQFDKEWAKEFRTQKQFTRLASSLGFGESSVISLHGKQRRVLLMKSSSLDLELHGPSAVAEKALEQAGDEIDMEDRFTK